jgi:hypothetical protein
MEGKKRIVILALGFLVMILLLSSALGDIFRMTIEGKINPFMMNVLLFLIIFFLIQLMLKLSPFDELDYLLKKLDKKILDKFRKKK